MKLTELKINQEAFIESLLNLEEVEQIRLMEMGFLPGKLVRKLNSSILSGPISFEIEGSILALTKIDAEKVLIKVLG